MKFNSIINNFSSGVWSPKMISRADTEEYFKACEEIVNMIPQLQGGLYRRPGTVRRALAAGPAGRLESSTRLIPWRISSGQKYLIVCNAEAPSTLGRTWFILNTATLTVTDITSTTGADFADSDIATANVAQVGDAVYMCSQGQPPRYFSFVGGVPYVSAYHEYTGPYSTATPWITVPYRPISSNNIDGTLTVTGTFTVGGAVTVVSSTNRFSSFMTPAFGAGRGLFVKVSTGGSTGVIEMTAYTSATTMTGVVRAALPGASPQAFGGNTTSSFEVAAWNGRDGWPRTLTAFEQRLYFGGSLTFPDTIWASRVGTQLDLMEVPFQQDPLFSDYPADNSRAWSAALAVAPEAYQITAMIASKTLQIHTLKVDIVAYGGNGNILGPLNKVFESSTSFGAKYVQPVRVNNYATFVQRGGRKIRDIVFSFNEDQYKSTDLMFMADHYTVDDPIKSLHSFEMTSNSILLAVTDSGKCYACVIDRDYKMNAWHEWSFGGTDSKVRSVAVVPTAGTNDADGVFFLIERNIDGSLEYEIEGLSDIFEGTNYDFFGISGEPLFYLDCAGQASGPATTITGLARFEAESVSVIADGYYIGDFTVTAGVITLPQSYSAVTYGLKYRSYFKTLPVQAGAQFGTPVQQSKTIRRAIATFYKTLFARYRTVNTTDWTEISFRDPSVPGDEVTPVFTGDKVVTLPSLVSRKFQIEFEIYDPFPMNLTSLVLEGVTYD